MCLRVRFRLKIVVVLVEDLVIDFEEDCCVYGEENGGMRGDIDGFVASAGEGSKQVINHVPGSSSPATSLPVSSSGVLLKTRPSFTCFF